MEESFGDDLLDLSIGDRRLLLELVDSAAVLNRLKERCRSRHCCLCCRERSLGIRKLIKKGEYVAVNCKGE